MPAARLYAPAHYAHGDLYGSLGNQGGMARMSRGKSYETYHKKYTPDVSAEGGLLRHEPKKNKATDAQKDEIKRGSGPSSGGLEPLEHTIDARTNGEERRLLSVPAPIGGPQPIADMSKYT